MNYRVTKGTTAQPAKGRRREVQARVGESGLLECRVWIRERLEQDVAADPRGNHISKPVGSLPLHRTCQATPRITRDHQRGNGVPMVVDAYLKRPPPPGR